MKTMFAVFALFSTVASISLACGENERCAVPEDVSVINRPIKGSSSVGKKGVVCSVAGARVQFLVTDKALELKNLDTQKAESFSLSEYIVNRNGNEELSGKTGNASHTITVSQMETGIALIFEIQRGHNFMNTALDSRLCK